MSKAFSRSGLHFCNGRIIWKSIGAHQNIRSQTIHDLPDILLIVHTGAPIIGSNWHPRLSH